MENLEYYLEYLEYQKHYSFYTVDNYREDLEEFFAYLDREGLSYLKLEYSDIRLYLMYLKDERKLKASSIDRHLSSLRGYYQYLEKENKVKSNVFSFIRGPKKDKILPHYFEYNEIEELFSINDMNNPGNTFSPKRYNPEITPWHTGTDNTDNINKSISIILNIRPL